ncbi:MAG: PLP-dependent aminotransferase family protein [Clostridia bacterium]|nr:PLP-dependent aminotransferase family protein [Clostridia bacterium]
MLTYSFENIGAESLYMHLYKCIRDDIVAGVIRPGEKLPSKRSFAENLGVSVITVENAYAQLISEGYLYSLPKKGFFAAEIEKSAVRRKTEIVPVKLPDAPKYFADFSSNRTDPENFPFATWAKLMREIISEKSAELMINAPCGGVPELRQAIAEHLHAFRGIEADPNHIIVGAGTEYLYGLLIQLLGFDKIYALEDPGYRKVGQIFESHGVKYVYTPMDDAGIEPGALTESGADILHISPSHHFPTGIITPAVRRYALLSWAAQDEQRYIIEDDYDSEFRLTGKPIPALQSMDVTDHVIYMNTFTKSLASTIRISYMVLPAALAERFYQQLGFYACTVSNLEQYTLAKFISDGYFEKHINRMRTRYKLKKDRLLAEMQRSGLLQCAEIDREDSGLHFLLRMRSAVNGERIREEAFREGIRITSLSDYYHAAKPKEGAEFVISYSAMQDGQIAEAVRRLTLAVKRAGGAQ